MAHSKSAQKRMRQGEQRHLANRRRKDSVKKVVREFQAAIESGNKDDAAAKLRAAQKRLDQVAARGAIHKNAASRRKARMAKRLHKLATGAK